GAVTDSQREAIEAQLESQQASAYVESYEHGSQDQALELFQDQYANLDMAESVTADQLPESFRAALVNPEQYEVVNEMFSGVPGVEDVSDQRELLESHLSLLNIVTVYAVTLAIIILLTVILLIFD